MKIQNTKEFILSTLYEEIVRDIKRSVPIFLVTDYSDILAHWI